MGTYFIVRVITGFGNVIITLICLQAIMSWFVSAMPPGAIRFYNLLASLTEPFVRPFRGSLPRDLRIPWESTFRL